MSLQVALSLKNLMQDSMYIKFRFSFLLRKTWSPEKTDKYPWQQEIINQVTNYARCVLWSILQTFYGHLIQSNLPAYLQLKSFNSTHLFLCFFMHILSFYTVSRWVQNNTLDKSTASSMPFMQVACPWIILNEN